MTEKILNQWLLQNDRLLQNAKRWLIEASYKSQPDMLPAREFQMLIESSVIEIKRLQRELDLANEKIREMNNAKKDETPEPDLQTRKK
jgi:hypothetical protein